MFLFLLRRSEPSIMSMREFNNSRAEGMTITTSIADRPSPAAGSCDRPPNRRCLCAASYITLHTTVVCNNAYITLLWYMVLLCLLHSPLTNLVPGHASTPAQYYRPSFGKGLRNRHGLYHCLYRKLWFMIAASQNWFQSAFYSVGRNCNSILCYATPITEEPWLSGTLWHWDIPNKDNC